MLSQLDADCRKILQKVQIGLVPQPPGVPRDRCHQNRQCALCLYFIDVAHKVCAISAPCLKLGMLLIIVTELKEYEIPRPQVLHHHGIVPLLPERFRRKARVRVIRHGNVRIQKSRQHLSPAAVAGPRRIGIIRQLVCHRRISRQVNHRHLRLLHGQGMQPRAVSQNGDVQRGIPENLCVPGRHDVTDVRHHRIRTASYRRLVKAQPPPAGKDQNLSRLLRWPQGDAHPVIAGSRHIHLENKRDSPGRPGQRFPGFLLQLPHLPVRIHIAPQGILLHLRQVLSLIPVQGLESCVQLRNPQQLLLSFVLLRNEPIALFGRIQVAADHMGHSFCRFVFTPKPEFSAEHPTMHRPFRFHPTPARPPGRRAQGPVPSPECMPSECRDSLPCRA